MCYVLIFCLEHFCEKPQSDLWRSVELLVFVKSLKTGMHNLGGHWQLGPDVCMWRSSFEQNLSPGFQFEFEICFKFKVCRTKEKTYLMLWWSHSIVSGLLLAFRTSYSFLSSWLSVALNKSGQQKLSAESYFILLHTIPFGTLQYFILASAGLSVGYSPQQVQLVLVHHHQVSLNMRPGCRGIFH